MGQDDRTIPAFLQAAKGGFLLIDIRHDPSANDKQMYQWMRHYGFDPIIIATKLDKINRSQIQKAAQGNSGWLRGTEGYDHHPVFLSFQAGTGRNL